MTSTLPHVEEILPGCGFSTRPIDRVVLDYDDRFRRRVVLKGEKGTRFLLELPEPRLLMDGDGLRLSTGGVVAVEAAPENLAEISCASPDALVRVAWHLGNRHLPTQLMDGKLRIRADHVMIDLVEKLGATVRLLKAPFQPEGGAYGHGQVRGHRHTHPHDHEHDRGGGHAEQTHD